MGKVILGVAVTVAALAMTGALYCCMIAGAEEDRRMEKLRENMEESTEDNDG